MWLWFRCFGLQGKGRAKAGATKAAQLKCREKGAELKSVKDKLKDKTKEVRDLETKFKKWKARNPNSAISKAHGALPNPIGDAEMKDILLAFAKHTRDSGGQELLMESHEHIESSLSVKGKRYLDYCRVCLHYRLEVDDVVEQEDGKKIDKTFNTLLDYEQLGYLSKTKADTKQRRYAKKKGLPRGHEYVWFVKEMREDNEQMDRSRQKLQVTKSMEEVEQENREKVFGIKMSAEPDLFVQQLFRS